jgi:hypothetical protein
VQGETPHGFKQRVVDVLRDPRAMLPRSMVDDILQVALGAAVQADLQAHGLRRLRFSMSIRFSPRLASSSAGSTMARSSSDST